jgi:hypothetical protein
MTKAEIQAHVARHTPPYRLKQLPPLPPELQQVADVSHLPEREAAPQLGITYMEYRERLNKARRIIAPHARCLVTDGAGI